MRLTSLKQLNNHSDEIERLQLLPEIIEEIQQALALKGTVWIIRDWDEAYATGTQDVDYHKYPAGDNFLVNIRPGEVKVVMEFPVIMNRKVSLTQRGPTLSGTHYDSDPGDR